MAQKKKLVSIVVPFYNEGEGVDFFHRSICPFFDQLANYDFEVVCVDDGSKDDTLPRLLGLVEKDARFRVVELSRNFGKEAALTAGLDAALGDAVIPIDADLQDPPELISQMLEQWEKGAEVVLARRVDRSSDGYLKRSTAEMFYRLHNMLSPIQIPSNVGDFRLMDRNCVEALKLLPERQRFMKGLFAWVGFRTVVLDYKRNPRLVGTTKFSGWKLWNFAIEGITSFGAAPLKIWTYIGGIGAVLTTCYAIFIVVRTLLYGKDFPGYASTFTAVLLLGSFQLMSIGMLGEYMGRIYMETKQRPVYLIRKKHESKNES